MTTTRRHVPETSPRLGRRAFLGRTAALAAAFGTPAWLLQACGDRQASTPPLTVDPSRPWWLQNNFAPVVEELTTFDLPVRGSIPRELSGLYVRNGSNPQRSNSRHWFFGDGMVHGVRLDGGRALAFRNRYVQTELYRTDFTIGDGFFIPVHGANQSNVSCVYHGGRLLTSGEIGVPHQLDPEDLSTIGFHDFGGRLTTSFTAHPKIDPATGHMHFFGYWFADPFLSYHVVDPAGELISSQVIPVQKPTMMHSFAITDRDVLFWELPVLFDVAAAAQGRADVFRWDPGYGARIGIMPLGGSATDIRWVEVPLGYVYHETNAYRRGDEIVLDVSRYDRMFDRGHDFLGADLTLRRWTIRDSGGDLSFSEEVVLDRPLEFPMRDHRITGRQHRFGWFNELRYSLETFNPGGITRVDFSNGSSSSWDPGEARQAAEPYFVPGGPGEGDGWLLTYVYDRASDSSVLAILDATSVARGPIAEITLPQRVPFGFHGTWVPGTAG